MEPSSVVEFVDDDAAYQQWLSTHPRGFVINTPRSRTPSYMMLHRADCRSISQYTRMAQPGGFTERDYIKICADTVDALKRWVRRHGRPDGSFTGICSLCDPDT